MFLPAANGKVDSLPLERLAGLGKEGLNAEQRTPLAFYREGALQLSAAPKIPWDSQRIRAAELTTPFAALVNTDAGLRHWLETIETWGLGFVSQVPPTREGTIAVARRVAYIRESLFGGYWELMADQSFPDLAYTPVALALHTDGSYNFDGPGYQMFHCLKTATEGGQTVLCDGLHLAESLRRSDPEAFVALTKVAVPHAYVDPAHGLDLLAARPLLQLGSDAQLRQITFNQEDEIPFVLSEEHAQAWRRGYQAVAQALAEPVNQHRFLLEPGTVVLLDNWRVLHGRTAFVGSRCLSGVYLNKEDLEGRLRALKRGR